MLLTKFKILGHSMEPTLKNGEEVLVSYIPYLFKNLNVNDIVAVRDKSGKVLIKRIEKISDKKFFIKGDNSVDSLDSRSFGYIEKKQILGKVIYKF